MTEDTGIRIDFGVEVDNALSQIKRLEAAISSIQQVTGKSKPISASESALKQMTSYQKVIARIKAEEKELVNQIRKDTFEQNQQIKDSAEQRRKDIHEQIAALNDLKIQQAQMWRDESASNIAQRQARREKAQAQSVEKLGQVGTNWEYDMQSLVLSEEELRRQ
jgi:hypothetical protein